MISVLSVGQPPLEIRRPSSVSLHTSQSGFMGLANQCSAQLARYGLGWFGYAAAVVKERQFAARLREAALGYASVAVGLALALRSDRRFVLVIARSPRLAAAIIVR